MVKKIILISVGLILASSILMNNVLGAFETEKVSGAILYPKEGSEKEYKTSDGYGIKVIRPIIYVPKEYGSLVSSLQSFNNTILWFSDSNHTLRNVIIRDSDTTLYEIQMLK